MSLRKLNSLFCAAALIVLAVSCKEDDDTTLPSLNGLLTFHVEEFVKPGHVATMTPKGLSHPEDKGIGYYWKVTPGMKQSDTTRLQSGLSPDGKPSDGSFTYTFKDSLATYTVSCNGFAEGYSSSYALSYVTVVKPGLNGTIRGTGIKKSDASITFNEEDYYYINHNGLDWMRNNLAESSYGVPYVNAEATGNVLGRFYSYEEAIKACPEGWRLPTDKEWRDMAESVNSHSKTGEKGIIPGIAASLMADVTFNSEKMWEYWPQVGEITNKAKLAFIPAGYANLGRQVDGRYPTASFSGVNEYAVFWTADTVKEEPGMAYYRYIICDQPDMFIGKGDTSTFGASVRCVRGE